MGWALAIPGRAIPVYYPPPRVHPCTSYHAVPPPCCRALLNANALFVKTAVSGSPIYHHGDAVLAWTRFAHCPCLHALLAEVDNVPTFLIDQ